MKRWEYRTTGVPIDRTEIDGLGLCGWELCGIAGEIAWLKRDRAARLLAENADRHAAERGES